MTRRPLAIVTNVAGINSYDASQRFILRRAYRQLRQRGFRPHEARYLIADVIRTGTFEVRS
jgi:hypothetical protein